MVDVYSDAKGIQYPKLNLQTVFFEAMIGLNTS